MDPIRSVCARLRSLAVTLDGETARLQRALAGEESGEGRAAAAKSARSSRRLVPAGGNAGPRGRGAPR